MKQKELIEKQERTIETLRKRVSDNTKTFSDAIGLADQLNDAKATEISKLKKEVERRGNLLEDVINELDLSDSMVEQHGPMGTEPSKLVRLVLEQKDMIIVSLNQSIREVKV